MMPENNPNCDGSGPHTLGEVRVLPLGTIPDHGNLILCHACYMRELRYRIERNRELSKDCQYRLPAWETMKPYKS